MRIPAVLLSSHLLSFLLSVVCGSLCAAGAAHAQPFYESEVTISGNALSPGSVTVGGTIETTPQFEALVRSHAFSGSISGSGSTTGAGQTRSDPGILRLRATTISGGGGETFQNLSSIITVAEGRFEHDDLVLTYIGSGTPPTFVTGTINILVDALIESTVTYTSAPIPDELIGASGLIQNASEFRLQLQTLSPSAGGGFGEADVVVSDSHAGGNSFSSTDSGILAGTVGSLLSDVPFVVAIPVNFRVDQANHIRVIAKATSSVNAQYVGDFSGNARADVDARDGVQLNPTEVFTVTGGDPADYTLDSVSAGVVANVYTPPPLSIPALPAPGLGLLAGLLSSVGVWAARRNSRTGDARV